jgi:hypothetical protein
VLPAEFIGVCDAHHGAATRRTCVMLDNPNSVGRLVSLWAARIGFVINATEAAALIPLKDGHD